MSTRLTIHAAWAAVTLIVGVLSSGIGSELRWDAYVNDPANGCKFVGRAPMPNEPSMQVETWNNCTLRVIVR